MPTKQDLKSVKGKEQDDVVIALTQAIGPDEAIKLLEQCDMSKHAAKLVPNKKGNPDGPLPKWGEPEGVEDAMKKTPSQKKIKEEVKTIKVGEDAVGSDNCHYALVMDRKVTAVGTKDEMLAKCKEEGGRVWVSTKKVGDVVEEAELRHLLRLIPETKSAQDPDIKDRKGTQPAAYHKGLKKTTKAKRDAHFKKHGKKADDDASAYQDAPGDKKARKGDMPKSKYTKFVDKMMDEEHEIHVRLDHLDGDVRQKKAGAVMDKHEKAGHIKYAGSTDKGVIFKAKSKSHADRLHRDLKPHATGVEHMNEETQITEISKDTARSYFNKVGDKSKKEIEKRKAKGGPQRAMKTMYPDHKVSEAAEYHVTRPGGSLKKPDSVHKSKTDAMKAAYRLSGNKHRGAHGGQVYRVHKGTVSHGFDTEGRSRYLGLDHDKVTGKKPIKETMSPESRKAHGRMFKARAKKQYDAQQQAEREKRLKAKGWVKNDRGGMSKVSEANVEHTNEGAEYHVTEMGQMSRGNPIHTSNAGRGRVATSKPMASAGKKKKDMDRLEKKMSGLPRKSNFNPRVRRDMSEAKYAVDIEGMPRFYMNSDSPGRVKVALRQMLKKANAIKSVIRTHDANIKSDLRARLKDASTDMQTNYVSEKLKASDDMGKWVDDFKDSDAPQFKGKSMKKRRQMAIAAKLSAMRESTDAYGKSVNKMADDKKKAGISASDKNKLGKLADMMKKERKEETQVDEGAYKGKDAFGRGVIGRLRGGKAGSYLSKKAKERSDMNKKNDPGAAKKGYALSVTDKDKAMAKARKKGLSPKHPTTNYNRKLPEETQIHELSKKTMGSYIKKATKSAVGATRDIATGNKPDDAHRISNKRAKGINTAVNKLTKEDIDYMKSNQHPLDRSDAHHTQASFHSQEAAKAKKAGDNVAHGQHKNAARHHTAAGDAWERHHAKVKKGMNVSPPHQMSKVAHSSTQNAAGMNEEKQKKDHQIISYVTHGGQKGKVQVHKDNAFKALNHYRKNNKSAQFEETGSWKKDSGWKKAPAERKDEYGNTIKKQNIAKHLARKAMKQTEKKS